MKKYNVGFDLDRAGGGQVGFIVDAMNATEAQAAARAEANAKGIRLRPGCVVQRRDSGPNSNNKFFDFCYPSYHEVN